MNSNPSPETVPEMLKKLENEPIVKPWSCLGIFMTVVLILIIATPIMFVLSVNAFFAGIAPKQEDVDRANETIRRINAKMDDFEESLRPIREQIEALDHRVPKSETQIAPIETEQ